MKTIVNVDNSLAQTSETQSIITPPIALEMLKQGNQRFLNGEKLQRNFVRQIGKTSSGQFPYAVILSCIDSRVPTEVIFDQGIGDLFNARIAGNFLNPDILGCLEFACKLAGARLIVVMGHTSCGAIKAACDQAQLGHITQMLDKIKPAVQATRSEPEEDTTSKNLNFVNRVALKNVQMVIERIHTESEILHDMYRNQEIDIVGSMYDVTSGMVTFYNDIWHAPQHQIIN
jgi:carbonic anhydrase